MDEICLDLGNDEGSLQCRGLKIYRIPNYVPLTMFPHTGVPINAIFRVGSCPKLEKGWRSSLF